MGRAGNGGEEQAGLRERERERIFFLLFFFYFKTFSNPFKAI